MADIAVDSSRAASAFDVIAESYDETFTNSRIGRAQRDAVTRELDRVFHRGQRILEINCGTGVDAVYLGRHGVSVLACDVSARMISSARERARQAEPEAPPDFRVLPTEELSRLIEIEGQARFDGALSNFAGLNCTEDLSPVGRALGLLLKPGATFFLCVFGRLCAWEVLWYLCQGRPRKAFRRFRASGDLASLAQDVSVQVSYPSVRALAHLFSPYFRLRKWKGVGVAVPPTYLESLFCRVPTILQALAVADRWLGSSPLLRAAGDHVLALFERTEYDIRGCGSRREATCGTR